MKVYVHIPFCHSKCAYCDFYSTPRADWMDAFVDALRNEWHERTDGKPFDIETIYLGGGTPSMLPLSHIRSIIDTLAEGREMRLREFTIEVNPEDVNPEWVDELLSTTPIRRVSMGIQSFADEQLRLIGRRHSAQQAVEAFETLRRGGVENISCDLIYGLPGQSEGSWEESLSRLIAMKPEHISAYLLSYEPRTRLTVMRDHGKVTEADEETVTQMYATLCHATREAGYGHYEISNFALPGREAIHNSGYWDASPYIGLGPGAHSFVEGVRGYNPSSLSDYIKACGRGFHVTEEETEENRFNDTLITGLRTAKGIDLEQLRSSFSPAIFKQFEKEARHLLADGSLHLSGARLTIPEPLWLTSNSILLPLIVT